MHGQRVVVASLAPEISLQLFGEGGMVELVPLGSSDDQISTPGKPLHHISFHAQKQQSEKKEDVWELSRRLSDVWGHASASIAVISSLP